MRWPASGVRLERGEFVADGAGRSVGFRDLAARAAQASGGRVAAQESIALSYESGERTFTAQAVEVAVDPETGRVELRRAVSVQDSGRVLNPQLAEGQIEGATIMGMGYGVMEGLEIQDGRVTSAHFGEYKLPSMRRPARQCARCSWTPRAGPAPSGARRWPRRRSAPLGGDRQRGARRRGRARHGPARDRREGLPPAPGAARLVGGRVARHGVAADYSRARGALPEPAPPRGRLSGTAADPIPGLPPQCLVTSCGRGVCLASTPLPWKSHLS